MFPASNPVGPYRFTVGWLMAAVAVAAIDLWAVQSLKAVNSVQGIVLIGLGLQIGLACLLLTELHEHS